MCRKAHVILCNAHDTASSFLEAFQTVRSNRNARGTPTDEEQDLLRAMLVFSSAGLDSLAKQLIHDALPAVIDTNQAARKMFNAFVEKKLRKSDQPNYGLLAEVISEPDPRAHMVNLYVDHLTSGSLQSKDAIYKAGAAFDIRSSVLSSDPDGLVKTFDARNDIVHEMDVDFDRPNRNRTPRAKSAMEVHTNRVFKVAKAFLVGVDAAL